MRLGIAVIFLVVLSTLGCSQISNAPAALVAAKTLHTAAESCLLEVRDHGQKYASSPACTSLKAISLTYTNAGGFSPQEQPESKQLGTEARLMAWQALAISESGNPAIFIW